MGFSRYGTKDEHRNPSRISKGERGIWQHRYWEHLVHDEDDFERHVDYIYYNPVKHGYVNRAADWPYSSIHRYIKAGANASDWGGNSGGGVVMGNDEKICWGSRTHPNL